MITTEQVSTLARLGYAPASTMEPAIQCATNPLETFATTTWDGLINHAFNYQLCDCGSHEQPTSKLSKEEG